MENWNLTITCNLYDSPQPYLKGINKTFGGAGQDAAIHFSPIVMKRLVSVLFHYVQAVACMYCIPNLENMDVDACPDLILAYEAH